MSFKFSKSSREKLNTAHPLLQRLFERVIKGYDCSIIYGVRMPDEQQRLFKQGLSKTLNSKHLPQSDGWAHAVDVAPYPIDWHNTKRFYHFGGYVQRCAEDLGINIRWGGDWDSDNDLDDQRFMDLVHFELRT